MFIYVFLICGFIWYLLIQVILVKHINQGSKRMMRDMESGSGPRIGQPREWEPHEQMEIRIMKWATAIMIVLMVILYLTLQLA